MIQRTKTVNGWRTQHYHKVANLAKELTIPTTGFLGRTVYNDKSMRVVLLAFAPLQRLSEQLTSTPVHFHVFEGEVEVVVGKRTIHMGAGHWVNVPSRHEHSIYVKRPSKLLMLLAK